MGSATIIGKALFSTAESSRGDPRLGKSQPGVGGMEGGVLSVIQVNWHQKGNHSAGPDTRHLTRLYQEPCSMHPNSSEVGGSLARDNLGKHLIWIGQLG